MASLRATVLGFGDKTSQPFPHARSPWLAGNPVRHCSDRDRSNTDALPERHAEPVRIASSRRGLLTPSGQEGSLCPLDHPTGIRRMEWITFYID